MPDRLNDRLNKILEKTAASTEEPSPPRNQCTASSRSGGLQNMYGPDELFRCKKDRFHRERHENDYGTQWVTDSGFKVLVDKDPR